MALFVLYLSLYLSSCCLRARAFTKDEENVGLVNESAKRHHLCGGNLIALSDPGEEL
jgi:hypothetical protein